MVTDVVGGMMVPDNCLYIDGSTKVRIGADQRVETVSRARLYHSML